MHVITNRPVGPLRHSAFLSGLRLHLFHPPIRFLYPDSTLPPFSTPSSSSRLLPTTPFSFLAMPHPPHHPFPLCTRTAAPVPPFYQTWDKREEMAHYFEDTLALRANLWRLNLRSPCLFPSTPSSIYCFPQWPTNISLYEQSFPLTGTHICARVLCLVQNWISPNLHYITCTVGKIQLYKKVLFVYSWCVAKIILGRGVCTLNLLSLRNIACVVVVMFHNEFPVKTAGWQWVGVLKACLMCPVDKAGSGEREM